MVRDSTAVLIFKVLNSRSQRIEQVESTFNSLLETCIVGQTQRGLLNAAGVLVVDLVLLVAMLIGLLRHAQRSTGDIWRLLYRQVDARPFSLVMNAEFFLVYNLDGLGGHR
jgi:hypothetical protein